MARHLENPVGQFPYSYLHCGPWNAAQDLGLFRVRAMSWFIWMYAVSLPAVDARMFSKADGNNEQDHSMMFSNIDYTTGHRLRVRQKLGTEPGTTFTHIGDDYGATGKPLNTWYNVGWQYANQSGPSIFQDYGRCFFDGTPETNVRIGAIGDIGLFDDSTRNLLIGQNDAVPSTNIRRWNGFLAELGIWASDDGGSAGMRDEGFILSTEDVQALAAGIPPIMVKPEFLVSYYPLWGAHSPEPDLMNTGYPGIITGSNAFKANHPKIILPSQADASLTQEIEVAAPPPPPVEKFVIQRNTLFLFT
ncbi:MAG: hypothetical protein ACW98W_19600 [Candidatus Hodarchaeales archaeon]|jgi:hypothetical protein